MALEGRCRDVYLYGLRNYFTNCATVGQKDGAAEEIGGRLSQTRWRRLEGRETRKRTLYVVETI